MGARGPKPRPTALTKLLGNPGHRVFNKTEIQPVKELPDPPPWLDEEAQAEWDRVVPQLYDLGVLTLIDRTAISAYCLTYSRWVACEEIISDKGFTYLSKAGLTARPEVVMAQKYLGIIKTYCAEFGLSPSSRARMTLPAVTKDDDSDGLD